MTPKNQNHKEQTPIFQRRRKTEITKNNNGARIQADQVKWTSMWSITTLILEKSCFILHIKIWQSSGQAHFRFVKAVLGLNKNQVLSEIKYIEECQIRQRGFLCTQLVHFQITLLGIGTRLVKQTITAVIHGVSLPRPSRNCQRKWKSFSKI